MGRKNYIQMLRDEFQGYNRTKFQHDLLAGLTVAAVALPLALAFGVASGASAAAGLVTAVVAGLIIGFLSGAPYQISGPTGAMSAVLIVLVQRYGLEGIWIAGFLSGLFLLIIGVLKLGRFIAFIPSPVITGFTSGIALIIFIGQIDNFLGVTTPGSESALLCDRHLDTFLARAEEAAPKLGESYQQLWLNWLEGERDNLRAALSWSLQNELSSQHIEKGLRIAIALVRFWEIRGSVQEAMTWFERLLSQTDERISSVVRVNAIVFTSFLAMFLGNQQESFDYGKKAVKLAEEIIPENKPALTFALAGFASGAKAIGDYLTSFKVGERVVKMLRETTENTFYLGMGLLGQGEIAIQLGYYDVARERLDECLELALNDGDAFRIAHTLNLLGDLSRCEQSYAEAQNSYEKSAVLLRELGAQHDLASILFNLGFTYLHQDEIEQAQTLFKESMTIHLSQQNKPGMIECLIGFAACAVKSGLYGTGVRLFAASTEISGQNDISRWMTTQKEVEKYFGVAQSNISKKELQEEQLSGRIMSLEQAIACAMKLQLKSSIEVPDVNVLESLTIREFEVASLIGQGMSNLEIAADLILSKRTIETHVSHILSKLGFSNRAQIMRWAIDHKLK
jgi:DNA-binding CsgD family transcriptional regulator/tetratricopeptide (TPR) repeat protein